MVKPRPPYLISLILAVIGAVIARPLSLALQAAFKAIFDVTVQDYWKDTVNPYLKQLVGPWSTTMLDVVGNYPYLAGLVTAFTLMLVVELFYGLYRKRIQEAQHPVSTEIEFATRSLLRLRFSGEREGAEEVASENIRSYFVYWSTGARLTAPDGQEFLEIPADYVVFVNFLKPVVYRQLSVNFSGNRPAQCQVRQTTEYCAVVSIDGCMPACEMEMLTRALPSQP